MLASSVPFCAQRSLPFLGELTREPVPRSTNRTVIQLRRKPREVSILAELSRLMAAAAGEIIRHQESPRFLSWMQREAPVRFPKFFDQAGDGRARRAMATSLGLALWNATPLPDNGYQPAPLPTPEAQDPCPCESAEPYASCCGQFAAFPGFEAEQMWLYVVEELSDEQLWQVGRAGVLPPDELEGAARRLIKGGSPRRALRLLAPLFSDPEGLTAEHEPLLGPLLQAFGAIESGMPGVALERLSATLKAPLSGALEMRRAAYLADAGQWEQAWSCLGRAQCEDSQRAPLPAVEVFLLLREGHTARAALRARFWLAQRRRSEPAGGSAIGVFLQQVAADPQATRAAYVHAGEPQPCQDFLAAMLRLD